MTDKNILRPGEGLLSPKRPGFFSELVFKINKWLFFLIFIPTIFFVFQKNVFATTYGSNFLSGGTLTCESQYDSGVNACSNALDNNTSTSWTTADTPYPHWIEYDLGSGVSKRGNQLKIYTDSASRFKTTSFQGSNNGSSWITILDFTFANNTGWQTFTSASSTPYRYFRIYSTDNWLGGHYMNIAEWELHQDTIYDVNPPVLTSLSGNLYANTDGSLNLSGSNFTSSTSALLYRADSFNTFSTTTLSTTFGSSTALTASLPKTLLTMSGYGLISLYDSATTLSSTSSISVSINDSNSSSSNFMSTSTDYIFGYFLQQFSYLFDLLIIAVISYLIYRIYIWRKH